MTTRPINRATAEARITRLIARGADLVETVVRAEVLAWQRLHPKREVYWFDAMGQCSVLIDGRTEWDWSCTHKVFDPFRDLLNWYMRQSDRCDRTCLEYGSPPLSPRLPTSVPPDSAHWTDLIENDQVFATPTMFYRYRASHVPFADRARWCVLTWHTDDAAQAQAHLKWRVRKNQRRLEQQYDEVHNSRALHAVL